MISILDRSQPYSPAILLLDMPPSILCGIDLLSFTTTPAFHGFKDLPSGFHFIFSSETSSMSIRDGFWFHVPEISSTSHPPLIVRKWNAGEGCLVAVDDTETYRGSLKELWEKGLAPYRQSADKTSVSSPTDWEGLTEHITPLVLENLTQSKVWSLTSASSAQVDTDSIPGISEEEMGFKERELGVLGIDLRRTWPEGAVGRERTDAAMDRSWALNDLVQKWQGGGGEWGAILLGQMEACFLMVLTLANYSCMEEWKRCLGLVLRCRSAIRDHEAFFATFLTLLNKQLQRCEDVEGGLFDMSDGAGLLKSLLKGLKRILGRDFQNDEVTDVKEAMILLEDTLRKIYAWDLSDAFVRKGAMELEDGETVEMQVDGMDEEDETGEYAPLIIDLEAG